MGKLLIECVKNIESDKGKSAKIMMMTVSLIPYVAEARDWTNLKIPKAEADCSTKTPPRIEIT